MNNELIFVVPESSHNEASLKSLLAKHPEIRFVSLVGIDLAGNDTDERIPIKLFLDDLDTFLHGPAAQTDGSSVVLPGIATLNNAKIDMIADLNCNWFIDYNYENLDPISKKPIGTLRIPCFLYHDGNPVDSRHTLKRSIEYFKTMLLELFSNNPESLSYYGVTLEDIDDITITAATELEFWVKTPNDKAEIEELSTSQVLHEQYWTRTKGSVRTALEQSLMLMESYGLEPEMGHKEVGGVKAKIDESGKLTHIMEQMEIDWRFSNAIQAADNELLVRNLVKETFRRNGLEVTFLAKPIDGVAGSGEHVHVGVALKLKNGNIINLFTPNKKHFLSSIGYGALMGILKNYEIINPFISATNDSFRRLKPGFEAPVCIVTSLGVNVEVPSRNRTILIALIRDMQNPLATRFELRSPNPHTNTYLAISVLYMSMIDGIKYALVHNKSEDELLKELSKAPGEDSVYLEKERAYRTEEDVFEFFSEEERSKYFGKAPATVYENLHAFDIYLDKLQTLKAGDVFNDALINSFKIAVIERWVTEIKNRIINNYMDEIRSAKMLHSLDKALDLDVTNWMAINELRHYIMKDTYAHKGVFTKIKEAIASEKYEKVSALQLELDEKMTILRNLYNSYRKNLLDI